MPLLKNRGTHMRVFRPNGSRYANGATKTTFAETVADAMVKFYVEFGTLPRQDETSIEILGVTGGWAATVIEVKEPKEIRRELTVDELKKIGL